jgi:hypothetical protein
MAFHVTVSAMGRPSGKKFSKVVTFRLDDEAMALIEKLADQEQRPVAMMARILVKEALEFRVMKRPASSSPARKRKSS